jgi:hydrogenase 3 maturation protease
MMEIVHQLWERIQVGHKIVFLGVGSPLRADDSVGLHIVAQLEQNLTKINPEKYHFFLGESAPENFAGAIRNQTPSHVIIFDAANMGKAPGSFSLIEPEAITGIGFSTHMLPLNVLTDYLIKTCDCKIVITGIQPKMLEFGYPMTPEIKTAADRFISEFSELCSRE